MAEIRRKFWGWGVEEADLSKEQRLELAKRIESLFSVKGLEFDSPPKLEEIDLPESRISPPDSLSGICSTDPYDRAGHTYGKGFPDVVRAYMRDFSVAPDIVAFPKNENDIVDLLDWCSSENIAAIPYGGGSSVVKGTEPDVGAEYAGTVSIDMKNLNQVTEIDTSSRAANMQAGIYGPELENALRSHGLTLRHFPQSFQFSTLGGWIATRSGGHFATLYTHIDDFVENLRVITPSGTIESFRLPGSGAGPSPDRFFIGSEGAMGIITSAWMRLQDRPKFRANSVLTFNDFISASEAVRAIAQAGLYPSNIRILDADEAMFNQVADGTESVMVLGFESADHPLEPWVDRALECAMDHGGKIPDETSGGENKHREGMAGAWRDAFINMPYIWEALIAMGMITETYESAITWDRFEEFHQTVMEETRNIVRKVCGQDGIVSCRFTYAYPDGPAPYYSVNAPGKKGSLIEMGQEIKDAVSETFVRLGGTITHHHAVGRYHDKWYKKQRPEAFGDVLKAAKQVLDPSGIMNPGVLVETKR